jgi:hypothetical protein
MKASKVRICTSPLVPPSYSSPPEEPKFVCLKLPQFKLELEVRADAPCIRLVIQHNSRKRHRTKHSNVPDILPILFHAFLTGWRRLQGKRNESAQPGQAANLPIDGAYFFAEEVP